MSPPQHLGLAETEANSLSSRIGASLKYAEQLAGTPDNHYVMFRREDTAAWITFSVVFVILIAFDNIVLHRNHKMITVYRASLYTLFWIFCAGLFAGYVYWSKGHHASFDWISGYLLEWMLSFDNLFVFHLIFQIYGTPDHLKHKPLFWGICGAVFFRLVFIFIGEFLMHAMWAAHLLFGGFLVYTGIMSAMEDAEDEDPTQNWLVQWLSKKVPFIPAYDSAGSFFVRVPIDDKGKPILPPSVSKKPSEALEDQETGTTHTPEDSSSQDKENKETDPLSPGATLESTVLTDGEKEVTTYGSMEFSTMRKFSEVQHSSKMEMRATMLFLVVCCLEISDIIFAVDSTSAIVAQVSDLFLAYTSAVFAMLGLRATFFIIDVLVKMFSLLKYGVATVLVFIGIKLIISKIYHVPPMVVCGVLFGTLASSMIASVVLDRWTSYAEAKAEREEKAMTLE